MFITVDDLWSTPSTLHVRVTVFGEGARWRKRFYHAVPIQDIPEEALRGLLAQAQDTDTDSRYEDPSLF